MSLLNATWQKPKRRDHSIRRKNQQLTDEMCRLILKKAHTGTLALIDEDDFPYALPINYALETDTLYFHCALEGHKLQAIRHCNKASFCVIDKDEIVPEKFTTAYRSVIVFGEIQIVEEISIKRKALELLGRKYSPGLEQSLQEEINRAFDRTCVIELKIEQMTGKQGIELTRSKTN